MLLNFEGTGKSTLKDEQFLPQCFSQKHYFVVLFIGFSEFYTSVLFHIRSLALVPFIQILQSKYTCLLICSSQ